MRPIHVSATIALLFGCSAAAADLVDVGAARKLSECAMELIVADNIDEAFALFNPHWSIPENELSTLVLKTIQQRNLLAPRFGKSLRYSLVREEKLSDYAVRFTFAEMHELHVVRWQFIFYKPNESWTVNTVYWDDNLGLLFDQ